MAKAMKTVDLKLTLTAFILACTVVSCSESRLSRSRAADTIRAARDFREPKTDPFFQTGKNLSLMIFEPEYPALKTLGLIEIGGTPREDGILVKGLDVSLTEAGTRESRDWKRTDLGDVTFWTLPIASRQLNEIIGVRKLDAESAEVEFTWSWAPKQGGGSRWRSRRFSKGNEGRIL